MIMTIENLLAFTHKSITIYTSADPVSLFNKDSTLWIMYFRSLCKMLFILWIIKYGTESLHYVLHAFTGYFCYWQIFLLKKYLFLSLWLENVST